MSADHPNDRRPQPMVPLQLAPGDESPLKFPTDFPIKVLGPRVDNYAQTIVALVREHAPDFDPATVEMRSSSGGKYLSVTATINATSREQLDALYRALTAHPLVRVVL